MYKNVVSSKVIIGKRCLDHRERNLNLESFQQKLMENGYFRQEEFAFADCDRNKRARVASLLSKAAAFAGYDYDARGLTYEKLYGMREVFLLSRIALRIHDCPRYREIGRASCRERV